MGTSYEFLPISLGKERSGEVKLHPYFYNLCAGRRFRREILPYVRRSPPLAGPVNIIAAGAAASAIGREQQACRLCHGLVGGS